MTQHTLKSFADLVEKARAAASRYYELSAQAKKTKFPDHIKDSKNMLSMAKALEKRVDESIVEIRIQLATPIALAAPQVLTSAPASRTPFSQPLFENQNDQERTADQSTDPLPLEEEGPASNGEPSN